MPVPPVSTVAKPRIPALRRVGCDPSPSHVFRYPEQVTDPEASSAGAAVRRLRLLRGLSLRDLAARIGVSAGTLSAVENDRTGLSVERLHRIAAALGVPAADLLPDAEPVLAHPAPATPARATVAVETGHWRDFAPLPIDGVLAGASGPSWRSATTAPACGRSPSWPT